MTSRAGFWLAAGAAVLLALGILMQMVPAGCVIPASGSFGEGGLDTALPARLGAGTAQDEPIAATDEMKRAVGDLLNYDQGVYRVYQQGGFRISVYAAWWAPGRMSPRLVAGHTPDICWPANGWERDWDAEGRLGALGEELRATGFVEAQLRVFRMNGKPEYVVFWHKVGDGLLRYGDRESPPWWAWLDEMRRGGLRLRKEQLFVRISSDVPLEAVWRKPELEPLRRALLGRGLGRGANLVR